MRLFLGLFAVWLSLMPSVSAAQSAGSPYTAPPKDVWHQVTRNSPFFTHNTANLRMAAVIQSNDRFARIILAENAAGAYVTVNLPGFAPAMRLRSDLVYANGGIMTRIIPADAFSAQVMTTTESVTYSFAIAPEDIRAFRGATSWTITPEGGETVEITLKGSAKAIKSALSDPRPIPLPLPKEPEVPSPLRAQYGNLPTSPATSQ